MLSQQAHLPGKLLDRRLARAQWVMHGHYPMKDQYREARTNRRPGNKREARQRARKYGVLHRCLTAPGPRRRWGTRRRGCRFTREAPARSVERFLPSWVNATVIAIMCHARSK